MESILTFPVRNTSDWMDGADTFCSALGQHELADGFGLASSACGFAGIFRDAAMCADAAKDIASSFKDSSVSVVPGVKSLVQGAALAGYDASKIAHFSSAVGASREIPWAHTAGKGYCLGVVAAIGLYDDAEVLRKETKSSNPLQKSRLEKKWWTHAFNAGANLSTLIYAVSVVAGLVLAPAVGIFLATSYLVCAVASYVFTKDIENMERGWRR
jgi:hypothetical protein